MVYNDPVELIAMYLFASIPFRMTSPTCTDDISRETKGKEPEITIGLFNQPSSPLWTGLAKSGAHQKAKKKKRTEVQMLSIPGTVESTYLEFLRLDDQHTFLCFLCFLYMFCALTLTARKVPVRIHTSL